MLYAVFICACRNVCLCVPFAAGHAKGCMPVAISGIGPPIVSHYKRLHPPRLNIAAGCSTWQQAWERTLDLRNVSCFSHHPPGQLNHSRVLMWDLIAVCVS